ncbi:beta strand repeat-containing protein [Desulfovibrio sp.]|uniref:beta strand repeat-containing protein n=1 Tax=Desulfovibrio sp. TaxID=885 RepID=UPI003D1091B7
MSLSKILRPDPGQTLTLHPAASDKITLGFPIEGVTLSRDDNALIFSFNDGAVIRLDDFYVEYRADFIPEFEVDGRLMSGTNFFTSFGPDLMPGAVPEHETRNAHVIQTDGDSSLMGGLDHLNGLDASAQEKSSAADGGIQFDSALAVGHGSGSADPELPPAAEVGFVRAVLYSPGDPGDFVSTPVFFGGNGVAPAAVSPNDIDFGGSAPDARYAVTVSVPEGWSDSWVDINVDSSTGRLKFSLTPDGAAELQRLGLTNKNLVDLVHVNVADRVSGGTFEYDVELVATSNQNFDSIEYDRQGVGHHLESIGEFHQGQHNGGVYSIISSSRNDEIILNDNVAGGSSIYASGSVDRAHMADDTNTITLNAGVANTTPGSSTQIISANGALWVGGSVAVQGSGAENVIAMGRGSVDVYNKSSGDGVSAAHNGKNDISGGTVDITATSGNGLSAVNEGVNTITTDGAVTVSSSISYGMFAGADGSNTITTKDGGVTVTGSQTGVYAEGDHSQNTIDAKNGDVSITAAIGVSAKASGTNDISAHRILIDTSADSEGLLSAMGEDSSNSLHADSITLKNSIGTLLFATDHGSNSVDAGKGGNVFLEGRADGLVADQYAKNVVEGHDITINTGYPTAVQAINSGENVIAATGKVDINVNDGVTSGSVIYSEKYSKNTIKGEDVSIATTTVGNTLGAVVEAGYYSKVLIEADEGKGKVSIIGTNMAYGITALDMATATIKGSDITIEGGLGIYGHGGSTRADAGDTGTVTIKGVTAGLSTPYSDGYSLVKGGDITITGANVLQAEGGRNIIEIGFGGKVLLEGEVGMLAADAGGSNTLEGNGGALTVAITATGSAAKPAVAMWTSSTPVSEQGGANYITGYSLPGEREGDSITLTARGGNAGKNFAMLAEYNGRNIILTGAGDDTVTINGDVKGSFARSDGTTTFTGPGNEINMRGGKNNTLILNGAVEAGSLKVSSVQGTYTLVLQAPDAESFVARYGDWITAIGADPLIADGLRGISFVGLNPADLPADFMTTFEGVLEAIYTRAGADAIVPPELIDLLPGHDSGFAVSFAETDAEHQTQDAQHAATGYDVSTQDAQHAATGYDVSTQDAQHAATGHDASTQDAQHDATGHDASTQDAQNATTGHDASTQEVQHAAAGHTDSTQETPPAAYEGSVHMAGDGSQVAVAAASVQSDTAALHADILVPDDIAQPGLVAGEHEVEPAQPLFAFLNAPGAGAHVDTSAYEGDALLHNDHLGSGESQSGIAGVQGEITLTLGDESLDSLFAGADQHLAENGEHGLWYVESGSDLHEVALTDISAIIVQGSPGEHVSDTGVTIEEYTYFEHAVVSAPSVMDFNQEATDNAVREMANC